MATTTPGLTIQSPAVLPPEEARALFDDQARKLVGMSGEEFLRRWDAGAFRDVDLDATPEGRRIAHLALLIPFGRPNS